MLLYFPMPHLGQGPRVTATRHPRKLAHPRGRCASDSHLIANQRHPSVPLAICRPSLSRRRCPSSRRCRSSGPRSPPAPTYPPHRRPHLHAQHDSSSDDESTTMVTACIDYVVTQLIQNESCSVIQELRGYPDPKLQPGRTLTKASDRSKVNDVYGNYNCSIVYHPSQALVNGHLCRQSI